MEIPRQSRPLWPLLRPIKIPGFTPTELAAAEQLVQLSGSSCDSSAATALQRSLSPALQRSLSPALSSSSPASIGSISRPPNVDPTPFASAEDDDDDDGGFQRLRPRYRLLSDVYADCERIDEDRRTGVAAPRRRKKRDWD
ncbi:hypothetical protein KSP39_PZI022532 [Platanthera zijinensis]|uniref:Uncharacterized protein n=1 Tax=Platanthera zijinensis TaxID=2320716 RepID=A0AAP0AUV8_9ASPA